MAGSQAGCLGPIESLGVWCEEGESARGSGGLDDETTRRWRLCKTQLRPAFQKHPRAASGSRAARDVLRELCGAKRSGAAVTTGLRHASLGLCAGSELHFLLILPQPSRWNHSSSSLFPRVLDLCSFRLLLSLIDWAWGWSIANFAFAPAGELRW